MPFSADVRPQDQALTAQGEVALLYESSWHRCSALSFDRTVQQTINLPIQKHV